MNNLSRIISISGDLGSGKSLVSSLLKEQLGYELISTGMIQREIASEMGMTSLELNLYAEKHPEIDERIDSLITQLEEKNNQAIVDSRMAWHFIPSSLKIFLTVDPYIAAQRIKSANRSSEEKYKTDQEAVDAIRARRGSEIKRFSQKYNVDLDDWKNFDIVINTSLVPPTEVVATILRLMTIEAAASPRFKYFISPKLCFPVGKSALDALKEASGHPIKSKQSNVPFFDFKNAPLVVRYNDIDFIWQGEITVAQSIINNVPIIPTIVIANNNDQIYEGLSVNEYIAQGLDTITIHDWEDALEFRFHRNPKTTV